MDKRSLRDLGRHQPLRSSIPQIAACVAGVVLMCALLSPHVTFAADVKLYLKDGTYQLVKSYEVHSDRVRFYSVERSEWEEIPLSLVDFDATKKAQQETQSADQKELQEAHRIDQQKFDKPVYSGFEVAPGIHLPTDEGIYAFDGARVIRMIQSSAEVVKDKKRAALLLAVPGPLLKNRSWVVLDGPRAAVRIYVAQPVFYVNSADGLGAKLDLIPVTTNKRKSARTVEKIQSGIGMGQGGESRNALPLERTQVAPNLYRLKPAKELALGEYALGELMGDKLNLDLWDFGIDGALDRAHPQGISAAPDRPPIIRRKPPKPDQ